MRQLSAGDIAAKLERIEQADRSRRWKKAARRHLLADQKAIDHGNRIATEDRGTVCGKLRHATLERAAVELASVMADPDPKRRENRLYHCPACKGYHLTSQPFMEKDHHGREQKQHAQQAPAGESQAEPAHRGRREERRLGAGSRGAKLFAGFPRGDLIRAHA